MLFRKKTTTQEPQQKEKGIFCIFTEKKCNVILNEITPAELLEGIDNILDAATVALDCSLIEVFTLLQAGRTFK